MAKLRVLPSGKLYVRNGKLSLANCCCDDPQPPSTSCADADTINPAIVADSNYRLVFSSGGPVTSTFVKLVDVTVTDDINPCPFAAEAVAGWGANNLSPRSNDVQLGGYGLVFCSPTSHDPMHGNYGAGPGEMYTTFCAKRFDIITGEIIGADDEDTEWYAEGGWEYGIGGFAWIARWSESQGGAIAPVTGFPPEWSPVDGELTVLSLNPFHAIATLSPTEPPGFPGTLWYPSFFQQGGGDPPSKCSPFTVEWTEV